MARYSKEDIRSGGFCKLWAQAWLEDEKLKHAGLEVRGAFSCALCCAQLVDWQYGQFQVAGIPLTLDQIAQKSDLKNTDVQKLVSVGLLGHDKSLYFVKNWLKWQSKSKGIEIPIKSELNRNSYSAHSDGQMSDVRCQNTDFSDQPVAKATSKATSKPVKKTYMDKMKEQWEQENPESKEQNPFIEQPKPAIDIDF